MTIEITALKRVPETAKGLVRDIRVRWALEEAGLPYTVRKLDMRMELIERFTAHSTVPAVFEKQNRPFAGLGDRRLELVDV